MGDVAPPGVVVILKARPDSASVGARQRSALLGVFRDGADYFFDHDIAFRVFYSVAGRA